MHLRVSLTRVLATAVLTTAALATASPGLASDFNTLAKQVPRGANAVMAIDVKKTLASPVAKKYGWDKKLADGAADRPMYLPPEADKLLTAAQFDLERGFDRAWDLALVGLTESIPLRLVARAEGGYVDTISGVDAVWIPSDAYVLAIGQDALVMQSPADRQAVGRWIERNRRSPDIEVSEYLSVAIAGMNAGPHVVFALDAANAVQPHRVKERVEKSGLAAKEKLDPQAIADLAGTMKGILLEVVFSDKAMATARIDFGTAVPFNNTVARALVLGTMNERQMSLPGVETWKCSVAGNSVVLEGELSQDALRRLFSMMEPPSTKFSSLKDANVEKPSGDDIAQNSLAYFKATQALVKDLKEKAQLSTTDAFWVDRYATRIDKLPILHVDEDLLDYGQKLSETLRVISGSRKMTNLEGGVASRAALSQGGVNYYDTGYGYGAYSYAGPRTRETAAGNAQSNAAASGTAVKLQGWNLIDNATVEIRREMTKRYNVEF